MFTWMRVVCLTDFTAYVFLRLGFAMYYCLWNTVHVFVSCVSEVKVDICIYIWEGHVMVRCSVVRLFGCLLPARFATCPIMKVYIERSNIQVGLIRFRKKC